MQELGPPGEHSGSTSCSEEPAQFSRRKFRIKVGGSDTSDVPPPLRNFEELATMGCSRYWRDSSIMSRALLQTL